MIRKVTVRLVPFLGLLYLINYLDRVNVGFAALTMNADLGLSAAAYGLGAGLFFLGYFLFEVPSNIILHRVGARVWIARIMVTWGLVASATAFIQGQISFYVVRVLLGVAEAGFFPGMPIAAVIGGEADVLHLNHIAPAVRLSAVGVRNLGSAPPPNGGGRRWPGCNSPSVWRRYADPSDTRNSTPLLS